MNYKVLYRKYRPDNFENIVGLEYVKKILKNSIVNNKIAHAYIFSGPRGTGKTSTAKVFAKSINCLDSKDGEACGKCVNCQNFATNTDIIEIDAASNNGVDQIREITNNIKLAPTMSKYKVYIIDEVHMLSQSAFNALLLTLEDPPAHVIFILATTNIESVPITILSRCQRFDFKKIGFQQIIDRLKYICEQEKIDIDDEALNEIAYISDGGLRDALSLLDQLSKDGKKITMQLIIDEIGTISMKSIEKIINNIEKNNISNIIKQLNEYRLNSLDYKLVIRKLIDVCVNKSERILVDGKIERLFYKDFKDIVFGLTDCLNKINVNVDPYNLIELVLLDKTKADVIETKKTEDKKIDYVTLKKEVKKDFDFADIRINNCFVEASKSDKLAASKKWTSFIEDIEDSKIKALVLDSEIIMASKNIYVILVSKSIMDEFNSEVEIIGETYNKLFDLDVKLVGIDKGKWKTLSEKYINDIKHGKKYEYIEENTKKDLLEVEQIANDLFSSDKLEID